MNLVIDQGNTRCKLAFFGEKEELLDVQTCSDPDLEFWLDLIQQYDIQAGILSTVKELKPEILDCFQMHIPQFIHLNAETPLPIANAYETPSTLGLDRLAAAVGAWNIQPGKPLLIIDMGTAITYDFVSSEGVYQGGNIAPGLQMRLRSLHEYTGKLPLVQPDKLFEPLGSNTQAAIRSGVMQGISYEVLGYIQELKRIYPDLFAFLTGGDLFYFDDKLKNSIFACKNLVLIGLNRILHFNVQS